MNDDDNHTAEPARQKLQPIQTGIDPVRHADTGDRTDTGSQQYHIDRLSESVTASLEQKQQQEFNRNETYNRAKGVINKALRQIFLLGKKYIPAVHGKQAAEEGEDFIFFDITGTDISHIYQQQRGEQ